tara:strand:+ start:1221 stop:2324 length:1104 start_codon:yes stop_codon:yes gene_type:complete
MIPFSDPSASYQSHKDEIDQAIRRVLDSGWYVLGQEVESFEHEFANFHGPNLHAVGVANGTDAIALCLRALRLGTGDEVITVSHTAVATVAGIEQAGCLPVLADIDPVTRCICPESALSRINEKTRAIIPVHIFGQPCDMAKIMKLAKANNLLVIEDCSQAHGAEVDKQKVGTFGIMSAFSCYPTKNLGGIGDGGIILTSSFKQSNRLKSLRQYGWNKERESSISGLNTRLDELQAAILRVKLRHLEANNAKRRKLADLYDNLLSDLPLTLPFRSAEELHAMHLYVIECENRDELMEYLRKEGVGASRHYPLPVHRHSAYAGRLSGEKELPCTELFYKKNITIPLFPEITNEVVTQISKLIHCWFNK